MRTEHIHECSQHAFRAKRWLRTGRREWIFLCLVTGCGPTKAPATSPEKVEVAASARVLAKASKYGVELTIKNRSLGRGIWLNGGISETSPYGPLKLRITDGYGQDLPSQLCGTEEKGTGAADYVVVLPGQQIQRDIDLSCYNLADQTSFVVWIYYEDVNSEPPKPPANADYYWGPFRLGPIPYDKNREQE